jgi:hypothetical protein
MTSVRILYALTPFSGPSGGIRVLFEHVSVLRAAGFDASIFAPEFSDIPVDFISDAPVLLGTGHDLRRSDIIVRPETSHADGIAKIGNRLRQVLFVQNQFYLRHSLGTHRNFSKLGIERVICASRGIQRFLAEYLSFPNASFIPCVVSSHPGPPVAKNLAVAFMPRKRREEAETIRHLVGLMRPDLARVPWVEIDAMSHERGLAILAECSVFLSLQRFEGFGLPALEAMAAGCLVAGFPGVALSDYARHDNGWWAPDDDIEAAARAVCAALTAARDQTSVANARVAAGRSIADRYSSTERDAALLEFFSDMIRTPALPKASQ